jgi:hypothetical protein
MRSEEQKFLLLLKGPEDYAHRAGQEMLSVLNSGKRLRHKAMSKVADQHLEIILDVFNNEQATRIVKTWLSSYHLPFDPDRLKSFDRFHDSLGSFITDNPEQIRSYQ